MLKKGLKILLSAIILITISSLLFEWGNLIVQKLITIDGSNSYLFRSSFLEIFFINLFVTGIPYIFFLIFNIVLKFKKMGSKIITAMLIQILFFYFLLFQGAAGDIFSDEYVLKNIFVFLLVSATMPFIDQKIRNT